MLKEEEKNSGPLKERNEEKTDDADSAERSWLANAALFFLELVKIAVLAGITIGVVRYFIFKPFYVEGQSMDPTFHEKEYLIIDEITYRFNEPKRGEVIVFRAPTVEKDYYLKRVIGLPGERVKVEDDKVIVYNNDNSTGVLLEEIYLENVPTPGQTTITLGPDEYFVMGDNRKASFDSRRFGPIKKTDIIGRAWLRGWPIDRITLFEAPVYNF
ncbi:MAG: signal peptidase I [Candidatus Magasanikbacteria bacterium RIFOXYC2_FULL_40_16]|uniref:Signal peptidase I n=2 Tax=Candidatus Magasanikiibacteriota TaxID=1752731 RepID=A0A1F6P007_9BACT|nr:MAG: signal peptidase I [Candidatus Magasanikbacteria bacterium RIFOXYB2_FULL_40_13]OGH87945.1 MAG: signal peptidase I [Candidatus Magasanikbacteria bacterium RIFOXYA1_FULL_40_8]OGH89313.1 MAG: signal peptidase I [Candidatus Magasanikbacteria bacterium RIFOXYC2_FULL_40_16]